MYYLNARYYDPELCRFISADETQYLDPQTVNGLNLYAYCGNNPVMNVDEGGNAWWQFWKWNWRKIGRAIAAAVVVAAVVIATVATAGAVGGIAGAALMCVAAGTGIGAAVGGVSAIINGTDIAAGILGGAIKGAATGFAIGLGIMTGGGAFTVAGGFAAFGGAVLANFGAGMLQYAVENRMNGRSLNWRDALANGGLQALTGAFAFTAGAMIGASGYYNVPGVNKLFSKQWWANVAVGQLFKAIFYYPLNFVFGYLKKSFFSGGN